MESKSFIQFVHMMESDKTSLIQISQYKKAHETEYETYNEAYKKARDDCRKSHNANIKGYEGFNYMSQENILKQAAYNPNIPYPELKFEEARTKAAEVKARNERIQNGTATHSDYVSVTNELYGKKG